MPKFTDTTIFPQPADRRFECQRALEEDFQVFTSLAEGAGWSWQEIALALMELTEDYVMAMRMNTKSAENNAVPLPLNKTLH
ncbi:hypothetical protein AU381_10620 [Sinorhizobium glycinis]|uniref:Uncharacterized protein n=1 Tax=Sinorhizobium glycinis TaxID=1472378 RepID=A0A178XZS6_9HYPH|nr:hypothetical protein [Sinorhizobium glycinis]OAP39985.1 hypothetical protein AU381_10620 [Sinorhizobium glycinis]